MTEEEVKKSHCTHGPNGKCINCLGVTKETAQFVKTACSHGPAEKCPTCSGEEQKLNAKHVSFEHFLVEMK